MINILIFTTLSGLAVVNWRAKPSRTNEFVDTLLYFFLGISTVSCYYSSDYFPFLILSVGILLIDSIIYDWKYIWAYFLRDPVYLLSNIIMFYGGMMSQINEI